MKYSLFFTLLLVALGSLTRVHAHGDEIPTDPGVAKDHFTVYAQSDRYELTLYYPEITAQQEAHLTLFVADFKSNRPVDKANLSISSPESAGATFEITPISPGVYEVHALFLENKKHTLNVQIAHPNGADLLGIQFVEVGKKLDNHDHEKDEHAEHDHHPWWWFLGGLLLGGAVVGFVVRRRNRTLTAVLLLASAWLSNAPQNQVWAHGDEHGPQTGGTGTGKSVYAPKETQFLFEINTLPILVGDYQSATTMFGTIIPASGGLGMVVAPQNGRLTKVQVAVGQTVRAGQVLAVLQQNINTPDQVGVAANNSALNVQLEAAKTRFAAAQRELERLQTIKDIAAGKDVQAAEANAAAARAELETIQNKAWEANSTANNRVVSLIAPISGVVGTFTLTAGAEVTTGQTLFTITNLNKVYVEAQVYDRDVAVVQSGNKFLVNCSNDDHKSAEVRLISQAMSMNPGNQSQRVLFEMDNPRGEFKIGEFVTLKALDNRTTRQISVPNSALTEINGKTAVFIKHAPETFELAYVQTGEDDGTRTLILKGIEEGEKVVINGAYEVKMMYLNQ